MQQQQQELASARAQVEEQEAKVAALKQGAENALHLRVELVLLKRLKLAVCRLEQDQEQDVLRSREQSLDFVARETGIVEPVPFDSKIDVTAAFWGELGRRWRDALQLRVELERLDGEVAMRQECVDVLKGQLFSYDNMDKYTAWRRTLEEAVYTRRRKLERFFAAVDSAREYEKEVVQV